MKDKKLDIGINEIRKIVMTDVEKERIHDNILNFSIKPKLIKSPWFSYSFIFMTNRSKLVYYIVIPLLFIISGGGVVFASGDSLPNSPLYPLKVNIVEPIEGALKFSAKAKAVHESSLASKRLVEAETLASENKLNSAEEEKINKLLAKHTEALNNALNKVDNLNVSAVGDSELIATDFRAEMNAHARVLDILTNKEKHNKNNENDNENENLNKTDNTILSNTARVSAEKIKNNSIKKEKNNKDFFATKKEEVESMIVTADKDIVTSNTDEKQNGDSVVDDTQKTIDQAKAYLYDANKKDKEGNREDAYSSLLDSESSVKEAKIFLKAGLKIKQDKESRDRNDSEKQNTDNND